MLQIDGNDSFLSCTSCSTDTSQYCVKLIETIVNFRFGTELENSPPWYEPYAD